MRPVIPYVVAALAGCILIVVGVCLISVPAGLITAGVFVLAGVYVAAGITAPGGD